MKNPIQPLMKDANGVVRFKGNAIVQHLLDTHPTCDMNRLACMDFTDDDQQQFAQLIGYSLSGYGDLSYVDDRAYATAAEPNRNWCAGCSPDNCSGCGAAPVYQVCMADSVSLSGAWIDVDKQTYHDAGLYKEYKLRSLYTTPQPDRTAELEAALKVARDGIDEFLVANDPTKFDCACDLSVGYLCGPCHADMQQEPLKIALAKINEVLK